MSYMDHGEGPIEEREYRKLGVLLLILAASSLVALVSFGCRPAQAQDVHEASTQLLAAITQPPTPSQEPAAPALEHFDPFAVDFLDVEYQVDSREDTRVLSLEGHAQPGEYVDVHGTLDMYSSIDQDLARFALRVGVYGRVIHEGGLVAWLEDFSGSGNEAVRLGAYKDVCLGGSQPFCRLVLLPVGTDDAGPMARAMFDVTLHERWSVGGFVEHAWDDDANWTAAEPELRYAIGKSLWATLEYRRDERWEEDEGLALGLRARL